MQFLIAYHGTVLKVLACPSEKEHEHIITNSQISPSFQLLLQKNTALILLSANLDIHKNVHVRIGTDVYKKLI